MADIEEIARLGRLYAERVDARDAAGVSALFAEDGTIVLPGGFEIRGHAKLEKMVRNLPPGGSHLPDDAEIRVDGDCAQCVSNYRFRLDDGTENHGRYEDEVVRTPTGWLFRRRCIIPNS